MIGTCGILENLERLVEWSLVLAWEPVVSWVGMGSIALWREPCMSYHLPGYSMHTSPPTAMQFTGFHLTIGCYIATFFDFEWGAPLFLP